MLCDVLSDSISFFADNLFYEGPQRYVHEDYVFAKYYQHVFNPVLTVLHVNGYVCCVVMRHIKQKNSTWNFTY